MPRAEHKIPDSLAAEHIVAAAAELDKGVDHSFQESTKFDVLIENRRYPPKGGILAYAVEIGVARFLYPARRNRLCKGFFGARLEL
jgi:hypothetical protein